MEVKALEGKNKPFDQGWSSGLDVDEADPDENG
jgi:hypothetical protein